MGLCTSRSAVRPAQSPVSVADKVHAQQARQPPPTAAGARTVSSSPKSSGPCTARTAVDSVAVGGGSEARATATPGKPQIRTELAAAPPAQAAAPSVLGNDVTSLELQDSPKAQQSPPRATEHPSQRRLSLSPKASGDAEPRDRSSSTHSNAFRVSSGMKASRSVARKSSGALHQLDTPQARQGPEEAGSSSPRPGSALVVLGSMSAGRASQRSLRQRFSTDVHRSLGMESGTRHSSEAPAGAVEAALAD